MAEVVRIFEPETPRLHRSDLLYFVCDLLQPTVILQQSSEPTMHFQAISVPLLVAGASLASAQLDLWAKRAGLKYFGAATDTPGQRERGGLEAAYPQYDAILADPDEFGQTTPCNGQKVPSLEQL